jgi:NADPH:quinone reductase-like Zn-dependent oxidoreductase
VEQNILLQSVAGVWSAAAHFRAKRRNAHYKFMLMLPDGKALAEFAKLVEANKIRPVLDKIFPFSEAPKALAHVETGRSVGKVVISMN